MCEYDNERWPYCSTVDKWQQLKLLQKRLLNTKKRLVLREKVRQLNLPGYFRLMSRYIRYQNLWKYGQMMQVESARNHQRWQVNWSPQMTAIFLAASLVYGINEVRLFNACVPAFRNCSVLSLSGRTYKILNISCVDGLKRPNFLDPIKIMLYYQKKIDAVRATGDKKLMKKKLNKFGCYMNTWPMHDKAAQTKKELKYIALFQADEASLASAEQYLIKWRTNGFEPETIMIVDPTDSRINETGVLSHARKWQYKTTEQQWLDLWQLTEQCKMLPAIVDEQTGAV